MKSFLMAQSIVKEDHGKSVIKTLTKIRWTPIFHGLAMSVCIPDTSVLLAIAQDEPCHESLLKQIEGTKTRILLSVVDYEFESLLGKKFDSVMKAYESVKKETTRYSWNDAKVETELGKILEKIYKRASEEQVLRLKKLVIKLMDNVGVEYSETMSLILHLVILEPEGLYSKIRAEYTFVPRRDAWKEKEGWLRSRIGRQLFRMLGETDRAIISQALTVKELSFGDQHVLMITTDCKWEEVNDSLKGHVTSFTIMCFLKQSKGGDACE